MSYSGNYSYTYSGCRISPAFQAGYLKGQSAVQLPANDFRQMRAVLDGIGTTGAPVSNLEMSLVHREINGTTYPVPWTSSGVWLSHAVDPGTGAKAFTGGNFAPPWFPSTTITPGGGASATVTSSVQRVRWFNNSAY